MPVSNLEYAKVVRIAGEAMADALASFATKDMTADYLKDHLGKYCRDRDLVNLAVNIFLDRSRPKSDRIQMEDELTRLQWISQEEQDDMSYRNALVDLLKKGPEYFEELLERDNLDVNNR